MILSRVTREGGGARSTTDRYYLFNPSQAYQWRGRSDSSSVSIYFPASSVLHLLLPFRLAAIALPNLRIRAWSFTGSCLAENLSSKSIHVNSDIHAFFLASRSWGFGTALRRAAKIPSSLVGAVGGRRGGRLRLRVTWCDPLVVRCGGNPEPYNGLIYAWGPIWTHSQRDSDPFPGCSPSNWHMCWLLWHLKIRLSFLPGVSCAGWHMWYSYHDIVAS